MRNLAVRVLAALAFAAAGPTAFAAQALPHVAHPRTAGAPPTFFYTTYEISGPGTSIGWTTCGYDTDTEGCYGTGTLGSFGRVCAVAGSSTRVVVADAQPPGGRVTLSLYRQEESSAPTSTLLRKLEVDIPASATAACHLAIGGNFAYFGTSESTDFYQVDLARGGTKAFSVCGTDTSAITANDDTVVVSQSGCFATFARNGMQEEDGGEFNDTFVPGANAFRP